MGSTISPITSVLLLLSYLCLPPLPQTLLCRQHQWATQHPKRDNWNIVNRHLILGLSILMGVVNLPAIDDYWKKDEIFHYSPVASRISCNRFRDISRYLHFADNTKPEESRVLMKPWYPFKEDQRWNSTCLSNLWKGDLKYGYELMLSMGISASLMCTLERAEAESIGELGLGGDVVMKLTRSLVGSYPHIFFDNFFLVPNC